MLFFVCSETSHLQWYFPHQRWVFSALVNQLRNASKQSCCVRRKLKIKDKVSRRKKVNKSGRNFPRLRSPTFLNFSHPNQFYWNLLIEAFSFGLWFFRQSFNTDKLGTNSTPFDNLIDPLKQVSLTMPCCLRGADIFWGSIKSWVNISGQLGYWQAIAHPSLVVLPWMIVLDVQWIFAEKYCCVFKMKLRSIRLLLLLLLLLPQILHFTKRRWRQCRECQNHKMDCTIFDKAGRHSSIS